MADLSALFFLIAIVHGEANSFSITELAAYQTETACQQAAQAVNAGLKDGSTAVEIGCIPGKGIEALKGR